MSEIHFVVPNTGISICIYTHVETVTTLTTTNATEKAQIKNDQVNFGNSVLAICMCEWWRK